MEAAAARGVPEVFAGTTGRKAAQETRRRSGTCTRRSGELTVERDFFRRGLKR